MLNKELAIDSIFALRRNPQRLVPELVSLSNETNGRPDPFNFVVSKEGVIDPETGRFNIDRLESGTTSTQRNRLATIMKIITDMQNASDERMVPLEDVIAAAEEQGIANAEEILNKLKKEGELFEPKQGFIKKI